MLDFLAIESIASKAAKTKVPEPGLERVVAQPALDSEGNDALRITLVLKPQAVEALSGEAAVDLLVELKQQLEREGEERLPIVEYATEAEMMQEEEARRESGDAELDEDEPDVQEG